MSASAACWSVWVTGTWLASPIPTGREQKSSRSALRAKTPSSFTSRLCSAVQGSSWSAASSVRAASQETGWTWCRPARDAPAADPARLRTQPRNLGDEVGVGADVEQALAGGLEAVHGDAKETVGHLVAEGWFLLACGPDRGGVELECLYRLGGDGAEAPPVGRQQPGQPDHVAAAEQLDHHPAVAGHDRVERDLAGLDQPEPAGRLFLLE